jgi:hypothetical protein
MKNWIKNFLAWVWPPTGSVIYSKNLGKKAELVVDLNEVGSEWKGRLQFPGGIDMQRLAVELTTQPGVSLKLREFDNSELEHMTCRPLGNVLRRGGKALDIPLTATALPTYLCRPLLVATMVLT